MLKRPAAVTIQTENRGIESNISSERMNGKVFPGTSYNFACNYLISLFRTLAFRAFRLVMGSVTSNSRGNKKKPIIFTVVKHFISYFFNQSYFKNTANHLIIVGDHSLMVDQSNSPRIVAHNAIITITLIFPASEFLTIPVMMVSSNKKKTVRIFIHSAYVSSVISNRKFHLSWYKYLS